LDTCCELPDGKIIVAFKSVPPPSNNIKPKDTINIFGFVFEPVSLGKPGEFVTRITVLSQIEFAESNQLSKKALDWTEKYPLTTMLQNLSKLFS
jgi:hypothetical protein